MFHVRLKQRREDRELVFSQTVSSLKAGSKSKFGVTSSSGDIIWSVSNRKRAYINQNGVYYREKGRKGNCLCEKCK